jgi:MscS family membrane protein
MSKQTIRQRTRTRLAVVLLAALWFGPGSVAVAGPSKAAEPLAEGPLAPPDTSSPRATLRSLSANIFDAYKIYVGQNLYSRSAPPEMRDDMRRAVRCLDLSAVPPALVRDVGLEAALMLKEVLDRIDLPSPEEIPGHDAHPLPDKWVVPGTEITIARVASGPYAGEYLFAPETVARAEEFYNRVKDLPYQPGAAEGMYSLYKFSPGWMVPRAVMTAMPAWLKQPYLGETLWQWLALGLLLLASGGVLCLIFVWQSRRFGVFGERLGCMTLPVSGMALAKGLGYLIDQQVGITGELLLSLELALDCVFYAFFAIFVIVLSGIAIGLILSYGRFRRRSIDAHMVRVCVRIVMIGLLGWVVVVATKSLGVPLTAVLTGLGIGGLAFALAAQNTIENVIAGITLFADRPVRVGDFCQFGDKLGTIEEIGLRSTRVRTLDRTVITVPNAEFAKLQLENITRRDRILLKTTLGVRYETTPEQLRLLPTRLREMLLAHPKVLDDPLRVRFAGFGAYSLDFDVFAYVHTSDWNEFLAIREEIFLRVADIVQELGTSFAFPSETHYLARDTGVDGAAAAAGAPPEAHAEDALPFPDLADGRRQHGQAALDAAPAATANGPDGSPRADESGEERRPKAARVGPRRGRRRGGRTAPAR